MKIETRYAVNYKFNLDEWLEENKPLIIPKESDGTKYYAYEMYIEKVKEFRSFLESKEDVTDLKGKKLTPNQIYNSIEDFKLMIRKLILIINLKLYQAYNINKETKIKYVVIRAYWLDINGKPFRNFSRNLGAEHKIAVNGKVPKHLIDAAQEDILNLMWDLWIIEYVSGGEYMTDENGEMHPL